MAKGTEREKRHARIRLRLTMFSKEGGEFDVFNRQAFENAVASPRSS